MNSVCVLEHKFFELLDFQPGLLSFAQFSRCLTCFFREKNIYIQLPEETYIDTTHNSVKELTGITDDKYVLVQNGTIINDWWILVTQIYNRWKVRL